jgi:hypothetical protein
MFLQIDFEGISVKFLTLHFEGFGIQVLFRFFHNLW